MFLFTFLQIHRLRKKVSLFQNFFKNFLGMKIHPLPLSRMVKKQRRICGGDDREIAVGILCVLLAFTKSLCYDDYIDNHPFAPF